ncbi:MAG: ZIP family metal transporter, partial [Clostridia bacterium]|nr:ZIP family metal transporter [Clostridia bacterium]
MGNAIFALEGILIPLVGTTLGAATVFFWTRSLSPALSRILYGLAAGVMLAASFYSLLAPAAEMASSAGIMPVWPALAGTISGAGLFWAADLFLERRAKTENRRDGKLWSVLLAVTLHNLPEGMAVGVILAGAVEGGVSKAAAMALALGIAVQNFPEGAI